MDESVGMIDGAKLKERMDSGEGLVLLDVREDEERRYCAISAPPTVRDLHVPMDRISRLVGELSGVGLPIVVYCHHGVRSSISAKWLASRGVPNLLNLEGGIDAWSRWSDPQVPRY